MGDLLALPTQFMPIVFVEHDPLCVFWFDVHNIRLLSSAENATRR
jgi:hypothetical protein